MIVARLQGGLGNQMFQYAASLSLARLLDSKLFMDLSWYENISKDDTPRHYELSNFKIHQRFIKSSDYILQQDGMIKKILNLAKPRLSIYREPHFNYDPNFLKIKNNTLLEGYFQTENYFNNIRTELILSYKLKSKPSTESKNIISMADKVNSVSLHVRRGDYVSNKNANKFHGLVGEEYYKKAIAIIGKKVKNPQYFVFSDEIGWVKKNFDLPKSSVYVTHNKSGAEDMRIMTYCKHNIIANSSFSWWGAWLGQYKNKKVIAPEAWFLKEHIDISDIIPSRWLKI